MSEQLEAALLYESRGWSIIPVDNLSPEKKPFVRWKEFQERRATPAEIQKWWRQWPTASVGIVTGRISDLVVVDIDPRHGGNPQPVLDSADTTMMVATGGGGWHLYYSYPGDVERLPCRVGIAEGVDIRADGGYAVLPPSVHHSGTPYTWHKEGIPGELTPGMVSDIISSSTGNRVGKGGDPYWFSKLWKEGAPEGTRNDTVARMAGYMAKKGFPQDIVLEMLETWSVQTNTAINFKELHTTVDSVFKTKNRKDKTPLPRLEGPNAPKIFDTILLNDYVDKYGNTEEKWVVDGWLPEKTILFMVAAPESYKTWMLLDLAISVATGTPFLGMYKVMEPAPVLVIQQEDFHGTVAERISVICHGKSITGVTAGDGDDFTVKIPSKIPVHFHPDRRLKFDDIAVMDKLEEMIAENGIKLVLIDPLYSATTTDDYMTKAVNDMWRIKEIRDRYGCTFVIAHHTKKSREIGSSNREDLWGSQFLNAFLETGWQIRTTETLGTILVRRHFKSSQGADEAFLAFDINTSTYPFHYRITQAEKPGTSKADVIVDLLTEQGELSITEISQHLKNHHSTISKQVKALIDDKVLAKNPDGKVYIVSKARTM